MTLKVEVSQGDVQVLYSRDGQVSVTVSGQTAAGAPLDDDYVSSALDIEKEGNHFVFRQHPNSAGAAGKVHNTFFRFDVPYRTAVTTEVGQGGQTFTGIMGAVDATSREGNITASYISAAVRARTGAGNIELNVIGEKADARTANGSIVCTRAVQGVNSETGDGDITLMVVGPSKAIARGSGRIDIGGARGAVEASTEKGDIHVKAVPRSDWHLRSASGNIRLELPPAGGFNLDVSTDTGRLQSGRVDIALPSAESRHFLREVPGGKTNVVAYSQNGSIFIR